MSDIAIAEFITEIGYQSDRPGVGSFVTVDGIVGAAIGIRADFEAIPVLVARFFLGAQKVVEGTTLAIQ